MIFGQDIVEVLDLSRVVEAYLKIELTPNSFNLRRKNMLFQWKKKRKKEKRKEGREGKGGREEDRREEGIISVYKIIAVKEFLSKV